MAEHRVGHMHHVFDRRLMSAVKNRPGLGSNHEVLTGAWTGPPIEPPFDEGWSAKVNNIDAKLYRVNVGLTGLMLNKGANAVELTFEPRLKNKGKLISIVSLLGLAGLMGFRKFKDKKGAV